MTKPSLGNIGTYMPIKTDIIVRIIIALFLLFIVSKMLASVLQSFLERLAMGKKRKNIDIDELIATKKRTLGGTNRTSNVNTEVQANANHSKKKRSITLERYHNQISKYDNNSIEYKSYDSIISLFESLQWGEGPELREIRNEISKKYFIKVEYAQICKAVRKIDKDQILLTTSGEKLPVTTEAINIITTMTLLQVAVENVKSFDEGVIKSIAKKYRESKENIARSITHIFLTDDSSGSDNEFYEKILEQPVGKLMSLLSKDIIDKSLNSFLINEKKDEFLSFENFVEKVIEKAQLFSILVPMPSIDEINDEFLWARTVLSVGPSDSTDKIKESYQKMAHKMHPDKLSGIGLSDNLITLASNNFVELKKAYETLMNKTS